MKYFYMYDYDCPPTRVVSEVKYINAKKCLLACIADILNNADGIAQYITICDESGNDIFSIANITICQCSPMISLKQAMQNS